MKGGGAVTDMFLEEVEVKATPPGRAPQRPCIRRRCTPIHEVGTT